MKILTSVLTFTTILFSVPLGLYLSFITNPKNNVINLKKNVSVNFDDSLRNYHPNKGE